MTQSRRNHLLLNVPIFQAMCTTEKYLNIESNSVKENRFVTCEQFPLSKVVSFDDQQHCSLFSQKACGHMPNFKSVIQLAPISITPATHPVATPTSKTHTHPDHASCAPYL